MNFETWPALFVIDVEGNGGNPPDLVEAAALPVRNGIPDTSAARSWLVRPPHPVTPFAARVHGHTNASLAGCPTWKQVADKARRLLGGAWMCAHNAHVDYKVMTAHLPGWQPAGVLDTLRLSRATYPDLPKHSLDALIDHLKPDLSQAPGQRHRATFDAYATAQVLLAMAARYESWEQLVAAAVPPGLPGAPEPDKEDTLW
ncbi:exonuclease domain-containing protein [Streptomyces sp. NPDC004111]|uniref:3'-5' exonuclease n=1 Tax=Streptomyces sp. NPDC004111 TaxID=3364690 RepID=UPI0036C83DBC